MFGVSAVRCELWANTAGDIDEAEWHHRIGEVITSAYLWGQSGKRGDERAWIHGRSLICDAIHKDGSFLDVGCANGYLMESIYKWAAERGRHVEPYGLEPYHRSWQTSPGADCPPGPRESIPATS